MGEAAPGVALTLYSRSYCHLCDDMVAALEPLRLEFGFGLAWVDVDRDPALKAKFDACVPVIEVDGKVRFRGRVNVVLFRRLFRGGGQ